MKTETTPNPLLHTSRLFARDLGGDLSNAKTTLSSWDNCMSEAYCKWPVIVAIIVGVLILGSILFCCVRCCCCGLECCCGCFRCCNACCPKPRNHKSYQNAEAPPQYGGPWRSPAGPQPWQPAPAYSASPQQPQHHDLGMMSGALTKEPAKPSSTLAPPGSVARFETTKPEKNSKPQPFRNPSQEDRLPQMPTWGAASEHHVLDESYHPPAESPPPLESELAKATGQEGMLLQNQTPQRKPTLPEVQNGAATGQVPQRRPTLPTLDSNSSPANASSNLLGDTSRAGTPGNPYGPSAGAAVDAYPQRAPTGGSRQPTPANAYGYGAPPRRPTERQVSPYTQGYPPREPSPRAVSPVSPVTPAPHSAGGYSNAPPSYRTNTNASAPPLPAYASRQASQNHGMRSPPPQMGPPPIPRNQGYGPPAPSRTPPAQGMPYGPPSARSPPPNSYGGYSSPPPQQAYQSPPPQQTYGGYAPPQHRPSAPLRTMSPPQPPQPQYQAFNPYSNTSAPAGRAELGGPEAGRAELHGAEPVASPQRYELGGGEGHEGGEWQRRPPQGWS